MKALLYAVLVMGAGSVACLAKKPMVRLTTTAGVTVAYVGDRLDSQALADAPDPVKASVHDALDSRNLAARPIPFGQAQSLFGALRDTDRRLAQLKTVDGDSPYVLLVENKVTFYSQLNGRYRWIVYTKLTAAKKAPGSTSVTASFDQAVFLNFDHEKEVDALALAARGIADRAGNLFDTLLAPAASVPTAAAQGGDAIYFVLVDRFANGDKRNDGAIDPNDPAAFHGGDLQGVLDHLDDLQSLGVRTLWLSPVFKMRTEKFHGHGAFHGYWVSDLNELEPRFGDQQTLKKLTDAAHQRGMRVVLDMVLNHVAFDSPLRTQKPEWFHDKGPLKDFDDPRQATTHDVHGLPDLAQEREDVYQYLLAASKAWQTKTGADGFRLDAVKHIGNAFWNRYVADMKQHAGPGFWMLGEMLQGDPAIVSKAQREGGFDAMFDFPLHFALVDVFCRGQDPARLGAVLYADRLYPNPDGLVTLIDNHDLPRIATDCGGDLEKVKRALTVQLTARGTPSLLYGTESALTGKKEPENRGDMRFDDQPLRAHISTLLALRRGHPAFEQGGTQVLRSDPGVFAYARIHADEAAIIAINSSTESIQVEIPPALRDAIWMTALPFPQVHDRPKASSLPLPQGPLDGAQGERNGRGEGVAHLRVAANSVLVATGKASAPGQWAALAETTRKQWLRGGLRRVVEIEPSACGSTEPMYLVGAGPELGSWEPAKGIGPLRRERGQTLKVSFPSGGLFEYKAAWKKPDGAFRWEEGPNKLLFVEPGRDPLRLRLQCESRDRVVLR